MCSIAGMVGLAYSEDILEGMDKTMAHRGPDGRGSITFPEGALLHRRLAIVDPEGGAQPMELCCAGEYYSIVYNGELYNTPELRRELTQLGHSFQTRSDTEVVLHAYAQWGEGCLERFNGIFGLAVWQHRKKRLFLARDRMGVKPLFYTLHSGGILFASEIKTLLAYPTVKACLDAQGAAQLLLLGPGRIPGSGVLKDIQELEPGWCGYFQEGSWRKKQYWKLTDREHPENFQQTAEQVRYLVTDAIRRQMVCDVPMGTFLSGGLDSSLISAVCAQNTTQPLSTFSVAYEDNEKYFVPGKFQPEADDGYIAMMQEYLGAKHTAVVLTAGELADSLEESVIARDLPGMADVDSSLLAFCKRIRKDVKMALSGECADEIFGGYPWYSDPQIREKEGFPWAQNTAYRGSFLAPGVKKAVRPEEYVMDHYLATLARCDILPSQDPAEKRMKEMVNLNMQWFMATLLDRKDRMSMHSALEVRVPFCDYRIAQYLYGVPWQYKSHGGREKGLLRYAMEGLLPHRVLYRKKSPYPKTWDPAYEQMVGQRLRALLEDGSAPVFAIVDKNAVAALLHREQTWPWYGQLMKRPQTMAYILQIDCWLRKYQVQILGLT